jgi:hypothetical protein
VRALDRCFVMTTVNTKPPSYRPCKSRKVKCDEGRPQCDKYVSEIYEHYQEVIFTNSTVLVARSRAPNAIIQCA